ncbi:fibronectin type III domain-containing protein [Candidatus Falkowbacteria bacterium]|nr:fibronectin type III domain-containing protein [Candidatus Falkowbacteria bacterium]
MKKITLILLALLFLAPTLVSAQVAAPPTGPLVAGVSPSSGEQGQTLGLTISGQNFQTGAQVSFNPADGISIVSTQFITATEIRTNITIAADAPLLARDVIVTNPKQPTGTFLQGFTVRSPSDTTPPPPILGLTATDALDGKIDLAWIKSDAEDFGYYALYWSEVDFTNVADLTLAARISDQITTAYQVSGLTNGTKYYFAVTAIDRNGNEDKNVSTANAVPTPSTVPPVTIPFPTTPAGNVATAPTAPGETEKVSGEIFPADLIPVIIIVALAALGGLIYSLTKQRTKKLQDKKTEIKREEKFRFLNKNSKLIKLEIITGSGKTVDLVREISNLIVSDSSQSGNGLPVDLAIKILDTQKEALQKTLGQIPPKETGVLQYTITIAPVSGVDIEWQIAEVSLNGGLQPAGKYEIKKQGDDFTYEKNIKVMKTDEVWKNYADTLAPDLVNLKVILQIHLDDLGRQEEKLKKL